MKSENNNKIIKNLLPDITPLFGKHLVQIVQFDSDELSEVNLALLLVDYTAGDYKEISNRLHDIVDQYSEAHDIAFSTIVADYKLIRSHPLSAEICSGVTIWRKSIDEIVTSIVIPRLMELFDVNLFKIVKIEMSANVDVSLAIITTGIPEDEYLSLSDSVHKCLTNSGIVAAILLADRDSLQKHPKDADDIKNGIILWQQEDSIDEQMLAARKERNPRNDKRYYR